MTIDIAKLRELEAKATPAPWGWVVVDKGGPSLHRLDTDGDPHILSTRGCGNKDETPLGVSGCMPEVLNDPMCACPMHPEKRDRDLIAELHNALPSLLARLEAAEACVEALALLGEECNNWREHDRLKAIENETGETAVGMAEVAYSLHRSMHATNSSPTAAAAVKGST